MLYIRQAALRAAIEESSLPKIRRTVITGRDLVRAVSPTEEADVPDDEVLSPRVREGDVLVPTSPANSLPGWHRTRMSARSYLPRLG